MKKYQAIGQIRITIDVFEKNEKGELINNSCVTFEGGSKGSGRIIPGTYVANEKWIQKSLDTHPWNEANEECSVNLFKDITKSGLEVIIPEEKKEAQTQKEVEYHGVKLVNEVSGILREKHGAKTEEVNTRAAIKEYLENNAHIKFPDFNLE